MIQRGSTDDIAGVVKLEGRMGGESEAERREREKRRVGGRAGELESRRIVRSSCLIGNTDIPGITDIHVYKGRKYFFGFRV